ncbi:uncharacterized protein [Montipora capricornis]|uniref:uncharacterized protein n=1 Tax=Montipora capricornis TaxID=246305 RepID=UPI0035F1810B
MPLPLTFFSETKALREEKSPGNVPSQSASSPRGFQEMFMPQINAFYLQTQYLVKWLNCSSFENSWEAEGNLTHDLVRHYDNPIVQPERLMRAVDTLRVSVLNKLKNGSFGDVVIDFVHDCFRKLFYGKGREANDRGYVLLEKEDFVRCQLPENWDFVCDIHGNRVRVEYPFKVRPFLAKSRKTFHLIGGKLGEGQRMLIEKLSLDFIWQAVALLP